jgi:hypothetical protein
VRIPFTTRQVTAGGAVAVIALAGAGAAFATITSAGSDTGPGPMGGHPARPPGLTQTSEDGPRCAGSGTSTITRTVRDDGSANGAITRAATSMVADGSGHAGWRAVSGCRTGWLITPGVIITLPATGVPPHGATAVQANVPMRDTEGGPGHVQGRDAGRGPWHQRLAARHRRGACTHSFRSAGRPG